MDDRLALCLQIFFRSGFKTFNRVKGLPSKIGGARTRDWGGQPQEYREYFEDSMSQFNTEIKSEGRF